MPDRSLPPVGAPEQDWPAQAADAIVKVVGSIRDKTTGKVEFAAKAVVFGTLAALLGITVLILLVIILVRLLNEATEGIFGSKKMWLVDMVVGGMFVAAGLRLMAKRRPSEPADA